MRRFAVALCLLATQACNPPPEPDDPILGSAGPLNVRASELRREAPLLARRFRAELSYARDEMQQRTFLMQQLLVEKVVLAEAHKKGYDQRYPDPQQRLDRYLEDQVLAMGPLPQLTDAEVARYYVDHRKQIVTPERVRVLDVVTRERAAAERVAGEARAAKKDDLSAFMKLVFAFSEDARSRALGGDMGYLARGQRHPPQLVDAAFALTGIFDVSDPVQVDGQFHVLKLVERLPANRPTLAEAAPMIRANLARMLVDRKKVAFAGSLPLRMETQFNFPALLSLDLPAELFTLPREAGLN